MAIDTYSAKCFYYYKYSFLFATRRHWRALYLPYEKSLLPLSCVSMFCTVCFFFFLLLWHIWSIHIWDLISLSWEVTPYLNRRDFYFVSATFSRDNSMFVVIWWCFITIVKLIRYLKQIYIQSTLIKLYTCDYVK